MIEKFKVFVIQEQGLLMQLINYDISALECIFLPDEEIIQEKEIFKITKFNHREFSKKLFTKSSSSWYFARLSFNDGIKKNQR
jgi:hypothetical protein